jgi:hypothetical protein
VMCALHGDQLGVEAVSSGQGVEFTGVVVGHEVVRFLFSG